MFKAKIINKLYNLFKKYEEIIKYGIFGILTTLINYVSYILMTRVLDVDVLISNIIAWLISVTFAFITNKLIVFKSNKFSLKIILKEGISFLIARILSLVLDTLILYIMFNVMGINDLVVKIISNVVVIIVNYILSKFIIFKKGEKVV